MPPDTDTIRTPEPELIDGFSRLAGAIDVLICDVWGVVHNGQNAHAAACDALQRFRAGGGTVVMVSNAPRPADDVIPQLLRFGVPREAFDSIITSGDLTRSLIAERAGQGVLHLGPPRDLTLFEGLDAPFATAETAQYCVCSGFADDERETPADYADVLEQMARRRLTMICANPDLIVERGHKLIPCAGAMAEAFEALGGSTIYAGKPHQPVYRKALALAEALRGTRPDLARVKAVGDAIRTDVAGAAGMGLDAILLLDGIHWADVGREDWPAQFRPWLARQSATPRYVMERLVW
jgi:HAD superfamily hydrolase (TIGR01459 family)